MNPDTKDADEIRRTLDAFELEGENVEPARRALDDILRRARDTRDALRKLAPPAWSVPSEYARLAERLASLPPDRGSPVAIEPDSHGYQRVVQVSNGDVLMTGLSSVETALAWAQAKGRPLVQSDATALEFLARTAPKDSTEGLDARTRTVDPKPTLADWAQQHGVVVLRSDAFPLARVIVEDDVPGDVLPSLYSLADYRVTSRTGGSIWLAPLED